ncbi:MAG: MptD family putative ECF transporter S component [Treponema sp.]|jgi:energy-coupling factor transport system substrate-specific component|nr:MptD family putative ECF transporter S component [Treponema sp.]
MKTENVSAKLVSKDFITIAIFSVIFFAVLFIVMAVCGMVIPLYPFGRVIDGIICGIVYMYLRAKAPKRWAILLQSAVCTLLFFLLGAMWTMPAGILAGGIIAEFVSRPKANRSFLFNTIGYCFFMLGYAIGACAPVVFAREWYTAYISNSGMSADYADQIFALIGGPVFFGVLALAIVGAIVGAFLGRVMLKKHFEKAGIV